jgi:hypothetical protein
MLRALAPYLGLAFVIAAAAGAAYGLGAPAWVAYAAIVLAIAAVLPGYHRWEHQQHP